MYCLWLQISSKFPKSWFVALDSDSTLPQLETFCRYLTHAAQTLDKRASGTKDLERKEARYVMCQTTTIRFITELAVYCILLTLSYTANQYTYTLVIGFGGW